MVNEFGFDKGVYKMLRKEKILQFGEGNFLRGFVDWMIQNINDMGIYEGSVVICQAIPGGEKIKKILNEQQDGYHVAMRGIQDGKAIEKIKQVNIVSRCINAYSDYAEFMKLARSEDLEVVVSNTTEAGISYKAGCKLTDAPAETFPAKVTAFLYERYLAFNGDQSKGLLFLPVELIDNNGYELKKIVLQYAKEWDLPQEAIDWIKNANKFTSTLVDRIVTGYPKDQETLNYFDDRLGSRDEALVMCEVFNLWVIEGNSEWSEILPIHKGPQNVIWTSNVKPYKARKVRILNGGHTGTVLGAYLAGHNIVLDFMKDDVFSQYLDDMLQKEVIPTLVLSVTELKEFASSVKDRFSNPYIKHSLLDISLNSCSKMNARCLPSLLEYVNRKHELPKRLAFALAAFILFYKGTMKAEGKALVYIGTRQDGTEYQIKDDTAVINFFEKAWKTPDQVVEMVLSCKDFWSGKDLTEVEGLSDLVGYYLHEMENKDVREVINNIG